MERYKSTDEFAAEFGDYRVNNKVQNLGDMNAAEPFVVTNDPYTEDVTNQ